MRQAVLPLLLAITVHAQQPAPFPPGATLEQKKAIIRERLAQQRAAQAKQGPAPVSGKSAVDWAKENERRKLIASIGEPPTRADVERVLRSKLRDPDSLVIESIGETTIGKNTDLRYWCVPVSYRAANGYGGTNRVSRYMQFYRSEAYISETP